MQDFISIFKLPAWNERSDYWMIKTWAEWFAAMPPHTAKGLTEYLEQQFPDLRKGWERQAKRYWTMRIVDTWQLLPDTLRTVLVNWFKKFGPTGGQPAPFGREDGLPDIS